jgi:hypothetical protein
MNGAPLPRSMEPERMPEQPIVEPVERNAVRRLDLRR